MDNHEAQGDAVIAQAQLRRERLRLTNFTFTRTPNGRCASEVQLEWLDGARVTGKSSGLSSPLGDLRVAAEATLDALHNFAGSGLRFELVGVKTLRAFDANVVIVSVAHKRPEGAVRLLGSHLSEDDQLRSSAIAVLNATNRILGSHIASR